jgi:Tetratricopeptide repeat
LAGARQQFEQVLEARQRLLGEEHPDTMTARANLAGTLYAQGDLGGARKLQENTLEIRRRALGLHHQHLDLGLVAMSDASSVG